MQNFRFFFEIQVRKYSRLVRRIKSTDCEELYSFDECLELILRALYCKNDTNFVEKYLCFANLGHSIDVYIWKSGEPKINVGSDLDFAVYLNHYTDEEIRQILGIRCEDLKKITTYIENYIKKFGSTNRPFLELMQSFRIDAINFPGRKGRIYTHVP